MARLFNYSEPKRARPTLRKLRALWPQNTFRVVLSGSAAYAFRYVIAATLPNGKTAYVERVRLGRSCSLCAAKVKHPACDNR